MTLTLIQMLKAMIAVVAIVIILLYRLEKTGALKRSKALDYVLLVVAVFSVFCYFDFGKYPKHGRFMNPHGWFHYYLGAKYSGETGYYDFYRAVVVANTDNNGKLINTRMRNMNTYGSESPAMVMRNAEKYRALFTPERWNEFRKDVRYFQSIFIPRRWPGVVNDNGYNATPAWNMVGGILTNLIPTSSRVGMLFLLSLDMLLVLSMLYLVGLASGWRVAGLVFVYLCIHFGFFMYDVNEIRGAFLRLDWLAMTVMSVCLLKLGRYKTAGGVMAYAGMARIFPLIFLFGIGAKFAWDIFRRRTIDRKYFAFFATFAIVCAILVGGSILWSGGLGLWEDFFEKIGVHDSRLSPQRSGFKYIFLNTFAGNTGQTLLMEQRKVLWWAIQATVLLIGFFCVRNLRDHEALAFGYVPMFFLTAPTTYYHIALLIPLFLFLPKMEKLSHALGAAMLFAVTTCFCLFNIAHFPHGNWGKSYTISWILFTFVAYAAAVTMFTRKQAPPPPETGKSRNAEVLAGHPKA